MTFAPVITELSPSPLPLEALAGLASLPHPCLLDGAADHHDLGRFGFFAADPVSTIRASASEWPAVRDRIRRTINAEIQADPSLPPFQGGWMGWFSYELGSAFDRFPRVLVDDLGVPDVSLALYDWVIAWDHMQGKAWLISTGIDAEGARSDKRARERAEGVLARLSAPVKAPNAPGKRKRTAPIGLDAFAHTPPGFASGFTPDAYRGAVTKVIEHVLDGDIFQANLAQRFTAPFQGDPLVLYAALRQQSAAPMAAFVSHGETCILSASPERFLRYDPAARAIETRPIKGTRPRNRHIAQDRKLAAALKASAKDRAENVMIVDLLRNDISRVANAGSVRATALCRLETHPTVHHLVSIVVGTLREGCDALDLLAAAFPGGSITGAPKLRAAEILAELEPVVRGAYCGAIGWIGLDGAMDTNIAIRTITVADGTAAFHAGGGVTALSDPQAEYQETIDKARALVAALVDVT